MNIQKLRLQRGWSQQQLADISGLNVRTIQRIERGETASLESTKALASAFNLNFSQLQEPDMTITENSTTNAEEMLALQQVRKLRGFYTHLAQYCVIIPFLFLINAFTSTRYWWAFWPAIGWGLGLTLHYLRINDKTQLLGAAWEKREVEKRLGRKL